MMKQRTMAAVSRFGWLIMLGACTAITLAALTLRHSWEGRYSLVHRSMDRLFDNFSEQWQKIGVPPRIESPVYFHYLDVERIGGLYNQIESALEEKQRVVTGTTTLKGKAEAGGIGLEGGAENQAKSTLSRPEFTSERKALEVMQYVQRAYPRRYYTDESAWRLRKHIELQQQMFGPDPLGMRFPDFELLQKMEDRLKPSWELSLRVELEALQGLIFVDGDFDRSSKDSDVVVVHKFSQSPKCSFRVFVPKQAVSGLPTSVPLRFRVFGEVTRPLKDDGYVDVAAIAIF